MSEWFKIVFSHYKQTEPCFSLIRIKTPTYLNLCPLVHILVSGSFYTCYSSPHQRSLIVLNNLKVSRHSQITYKKNPVLYPKNKSSLPIIDKTEVWSPKQNMRNTKNTHKHNSPTLFLTPNCHLRYLISLISSSKWTDTESNIYNLCIWWWQ